MRALKKTGVNKPAVVLVVVVMMMIALSPFDGVCMSVYSRRLIRLSWCFTYLLQCRHLIGCIQECVLSPIDTIFFIKRSPIDHFRDASDRLRIHRKLL
jgi:hypothetical protein